MNKIIGYSIAGIFAFAATAYSNSNAVQQFSNVANQDLQQQLAKVDFNSVAQYAYTTRDVLRYYQRINNFPRYLPASGKTVFVFDPRYGKFAVYSANGKRIKKGKASGGAHWCPDVKRACRTPVGIYSIFHKRGYECRSSKYPLNKSKPRAHMPYCMFFHKAGYAIHGHRYVPNHNASHGCIRLKTKDAQWLYYHHIGIGTMVVIRPYR